jgi:hypothetical protein
VTDPRAGAVFLSCEATLLSFRKQWFLANAGRTALHCVLSVAPVAFALSLSPVSSGVVAADLLLAVAEWLANDSISDGDRGHARARVVPARRFSGTAVVANAGFKFLARHIIHHTAIRQRI